jgi:hypothetical protein
MKRMQQVLGALLGTATIAAALFLPQTEAEAIVACHDKKRKVQRCGSPRTSARLGIRKD